MDEIKKTSEEWLKKLKIDPTILSPDGWDRKNFTNSWYIEPISLSEFRSRLNKSTRKLNSAQTSFHCPVCKNPGQEECLISFPPKY